MAEKYSGIGLTSITTKIYNALLVYHIEPKIEKILLKNQNDFRRNQSTTSQILTIHRILDGDRAKPSQATLWFVDLSKAFDSIHRRKMEQIFLAFGFPKETVTAIMMSYKNTKVNVHLVDGVEFSLTLLLEFCKEVHNPIFIHNLLWLCTSNVDRSNERKWLCT